MALQKRGSAYHYDLDDGVHLGDSGEGFQGISIHEELYARESYDHKESKKEYENALLGVFGYLSVKGGGSLTEHVLVSLRIGKPLLEFRILVKVFAPAVRRGRSCHEADKARRYGHHQDLRDRDVVPVGI